MNKEEMEKTAKTLAEAVFKLPSSRSLDGWECDVAEALAVWGPGLAPMLRKALDVAYFARETNRPNDYARRRKADAMVIDLNAYVMREVAQQKAQEQERSERQQEIDDLRDCFDLNDWSTGNGEVEQLHELIENMIERRIRDAQR